MDTHDKHPVAPRKRDNTFKMRDPKLSPSGTKRLVRVVVGRMDTVTLWVSDGRMLGDSEAEGLRTTVGVGVGRRVGDRVTTGDEVTVFDSPV